VSPISCERFGVSDMTIRRDLEVLHERGLDREGARRRHCHRGQLLFEPGFTVKSTADAEREDAQLPDAPSGLVTPGTAIAVSAGTNDLLALARRLTDIPALQS